MNSRLVRRLAADHGALHTQPLPPNYFFEPGATQSDQLTHLDILLAGPTHTPFNAGVWRLHLEIPPAYPDLPPTAHFRTPIFHPNVEPQTGAVCVETLKRDWDNKLTLRDVLVTISCLLIQPNPDSALNAEAGALIQESYESFARRAELMTGIHAKIPLTLQDAAKEAQTRGQEDADGDPLEPPARRRRTIAKVRAANTQKRLDDSPGPARRRPVATSPSSALQPFVLHAGNDDVFDMRDGQEWPKGHGATSKRIDEDESMSDDDRENEHAFSLAATTTRITTPRRPHRTAVPLGELALDDRDILDADGDSSMDMDPDPEYPPSPRKSPSKRPNPHVALPDQPESSRTAAARRRRRSPSAPTLTPPNFTDKPLVADRTDFFDHTPSPRKVRRHTPEPSVPLGNPVFSDAMEVQTDDWAVNGPTSSNDQREEEQRRAELDARLWELCGRDVRRWNRGDFDGEPFKKMATRW